MTTNIYTAEEIRNPAIISKKELAQKLNVSTKWLQKLLNDRYYEELYLLGYRKNDRYLLRKHLDLIFPEGID